MEKLEVKKTGKNGESPEVLFHLLSLKEAAKSCEIPSGKWPWVTVLALTTRTASLQDAGLCLILRVTGVFPSYAWCPEQSACRGDDVTSTTPTQWQGQRWGRTQNSWDGACGGGDVVGWVWRGSIRCLTTGCAGDLSHGQALPLLFGCLGLWVFLQHSSTWNISRISSGSRVPWSFSALSKTPACIVDTVVDNEWSCLARPARSPSVSIDSGF